jgi:septal ring factor EnvC (AmiA/AmiB activator)
LLDPILLVAILLLFVTAILSALYFKEIKKVHREYEDAKGVIGDVIISFNADIERERQKLSAVSSETEMLLSENKRIQRKVEGHASQMSRLATKIEEASGLEPKLSAQLREAQKNIAGLIDSQKHIDQRVTKIEKSRPQVSAAQETKIKAAIPIRRERALASLTQTELDVLEVLAKEGRKTAPEIKERIKLTREHTARLMKNLYERGYLERSTEKIPYSYSIKDEMRKILKNPPKAQ